ncbi:hypothetical protein QFZ30_001409 [Arthrobacter pascens]|uniref:choice-of-anchor P family protein n=1 Tax=Arthrobacter pascens TaxID=1677 RepID=UPI0027944EFA|nr:choice-of-anchor P family protein [Arthrobacter pascens]MDQ0678027.1 hypothetical protein [Arthrobacter pascens]
MKRTLVALVGALTLLVAGPLAPARATDPSITPAQVNTGFSGAAYGSYIFNSDKSLTSGPTANSGVSCTASTGKTSANNLAGINVPAVGTIGAATTSVKTLLSTTGKRIEGRSTIAGADLLGGLITAGTITSESSAEKNTAGIFTGTNHTSIASLKVLGVTVNVNPAANTVIDLKLPLLGSIGKITLNGQEKRMVSGDYRVSTTALRVQILKAGLPGLKAGTDIRLGVSIVKLTPPQTGYLSGAGFSTRALLLSGLVGSGPTAHASVKCGGGTSAANLAGVTIPGLASAGVTSTTTTGVLSPEPKSSVTNTLAGLNVLSGLVQADAIKAETSASRPPAGGKVTLTDTSAFVNLRIAGLPAINASVAPNTVIQVPGLGQVTLHKVTKSSTTIVVTMVEIVLNQALGALPTGSKIQIGYSSSRIGT